MKYLGEYRNSIPDKYKKWCTLMGAVLIHFSLGTFYTLGNLLPYMISYLRENTGSGVRYSESVWVETIFSSVQALMSVAAGLFYSKYKIKMKHVLLIGCLLNSCGVALTFFSIKSSFFLTVLTYSILNGSN